MKKITILGSTGSIGRSTLDVVSNNRESFKVVAMTAGRNIDLFAKQIDDFRPEVVAVADRPTADALGRRVKNAGILWGPEGIDAVASHAGADFVVSSIVGSAGLMPTIAAIRAGKTIGLANKEALVMAGQIVMREARRRKVTIIPVDSEHSAIFQCTRGHRKSDVQRIILTASGGPFRARKRHELGGVKASEALRHPNWTMGKKITIDSATLVNKGLEVIEAHWLFGLPPGQIDVLIHPQSIVHSLVEFRDGSCLAQMSAPDMRGPISYALSYPRRISSPIPPLQLDKVKTLTFRKPDRAAFPGLAYAYEALERGGTMPCVLNAANEVAVNAFLHDRIGFTDIPLIIRKAIDRHSPGRGDSLHEILEADGWARRLSQRLIREVRS